MKYESKLQVSLNIDQFIIICYEFDDKAYAQIT